MIPSENHWMQSSSGCTLCGWGFVARLHFYQKILLHSCKSKRVSMKKHAGIVIVCACQQPSLFKNRMDRILISAVASCIALHSVVMKTCCVQAALPRKHGTCFLRGKNTKDLKPVSCVEKTHKGFKMESTWRHTDAKKYFIWVLYIYEDRSTHHKCCVIVRVCGCERSRKRTRNVFNLKKQKQNNALLPWQVSDDRSIWAWKFQWKFSSKVQQSWKNNPKATSLRKLCSCRVWSSCGAHFWNLVSKIAFGSFKLWCAWLWWAGTNRCWTASFVQVTTDVLIQVQNGHVLLSRTNYFNWAFAITPSFTARTWDQATWNQPDYVQWIQHQNTEKETFLGPQRTKVGQVAKLTSCMLPSLKYFCRNHLTLAAPHIKTAACRSTNGQIETGKRPRISVGHSNAETRVTLHTQLTKRTALVSLFAVPGNRTYWVGSSWYWSCQHWIKDDVLTHRGSGKPCKITTSKPKTNYLAVKSRDNSRW